MTYNPHMYETVYGFSALDEVHNFFPELLYDNSLFGSETAIWMRHRIQTLFPQVFVRQQNLYVMYNASERMNNYVRWHHENYTTIGAPAPLRPPPAPRHSAAPAPTQPPLDVSGAAPTPRTRRTQNNPQTLFTSIFYDLGDPASLLNLLNFNSLQDVSVAPSIEQIEAASICRHHDEISSDINCAICMEHTLATGNTDWREFFCGHSFHRGCIDTWLASHTQCPICRADVRTMRASG
jgi:hypothetical protein